MGIDCNNIKMSCKSITEELCKRIKNTITEQDYLLTENFIILLPERSYLYFYKTQENKNFIFVSYKNLLSLFNYIREDLSPILSKTICEQYLKEKNQGILPDLNSKLIKLLGLILELDEKNKYFYFPAINASSNELDIIKKSKHSYIAVIGNFINSYGLKIQLSSSFALSFDEEVFKANKRLQAFPLETEFRPQNSITARIGHSQFPNNCDFFFLGTIIEILRLLDLEGSLQGPDTKEILGQELLAKMHLKNFIRKLLGQTSIIRNSFKEKNIEGMVDNLLHLIKKNKANDYSNIISNLGNALIDLIVARPKCHNNEVDFDNEKKVLESLRLLRRHLEDFDNHESLNQIETLRNDSYDIITLIIAQDHLKQENHSKIILNKGIINLQNNIETIFSSIIHKAFGLPIHIYEQKRKNKISNTNLDEIINLAKSNAEKTHANQIKIQNNIAVINFCASLEYLFFASQEDILLRLQSSHLEEPKEQGDLSIFLQDEKINLFRLKIEDIILYNSHRKEERIVELCTKALLNNIYLFKSQDDKFNIFISKAFNSQQEYQTIANLYYFAVKKMMPKSFFEEKVFFFNSDYQLITGIFNCNNSGYYMCLSIENKLQKILVNYY